MKTKIIMMVESVLLLLAIISIYGLYQDNQQKEADIQTKQEEIAQLEENLIVQSSGNNTADIAKKTKFVNSAFADYLNYNTDNYRSRFEDMENYFSPSTIEQLSGAGGTEAPTISINSSTQNYKTYVNPLEDNSFVFVTDIHYQVEDNEPTVFKNVYLIHLSEEKGQYLIDQVDVFSGTPTNS